MVWLTIALLIVGLYLAIFGFRVVFQKGYVEKLQKGIWKSDTDEEIFSKKSGYFYDKYARGLKFLIVGLIFTSSAIYGLLKIYGFL